MRASAASVAGLLATALLLALPAGVGAADQEVAATPDNTFAPADVTGSPGDTVTFHNNGGFHNVHFEDGGLDGPANPSPTSWTVSRKFTAPGTYAFYCEEHGGPGGAGMSGVVKVSAPGAPDTEAPVITSLALRRARGRAVLVVLRSSEAGTAAVTLHRRARGRFRRVRGLRRRVAAGRTRIRIRHLRPGRYRVVVRVTDSAGNRSGRRTAGLRLTG